MAVNVYDCCNASVLQTLFSSSRLLVTHSHHSVFVIHCTAFVITRRNNQVFMFVITPDLSKVFCYIFYLWYLFVASGYIILLVSCFVSFFCFVFCPLLQSAFFYLVILLNSNGRYMLSKAFLCLSWQALTQSLKCLIKFLCWYPVL